MFGIISKASGDHTIRIDMKDEGITQYKVTNA
jgi:hypothetical protein